MAQGYLTTHVLDTARGCPAQGITITLYHVAGNSHRKIAQAITNSDGRTDSPILDKADFKAGQYELIFETEDYLTQTGVPAEDPRFLGTIPIRFGISDADSHYHVPLLLSPFGYSTYRGS